MTKEEIILVLEEYIKQLDEASAKQTAIVASDEVYKRFVTKLIDKLREDHYTKPNMDKMTGRQMLKDDLRRIGFLDVANQILDI